jgi:glycosyltransferase involved in cell wall biosynthesis
LSLFLKYVTVFVKSSTKERIREEEIDLMTLEMIPPEQARQTWEVPDYSVTELKPKQRDYCVSVFVINEGERLLAQLDKMKDQSESADIVVADGGSTDGSVAVEKLQSRRVRSLLVKTGPGRLSAQMRMAFHYAVLQGYKGVVTMDGNDKDDPSAIGDFVSALDDGFGYLQGSRFVKGGRAIRTPFVRLLGIRLLHAPLISLAARRFYTDTTNGFRAYSRGLLLDPNVALFRDLFTSYELHYYLAIRAARLGYRIKEIPVTRAYPASGQTPTKIHGIRGNWLVLEDLFRACLHRFDPDE